jgi:putative copper export protein/methionine-rich copper-binding protein CopC
VAAGVTSGAVASAATPAGAHALAQSSDPPAGSTVQQPPSVVTVNFGEQPDPALSSLRVLDSGGQDHASGKTEAVAGQPLSLRVALHPLDKGVYTVAWRTVSKVDGHLAAGTFAFGVGVTPTGAAAAAGLPAHAPAPATASVAGRWLLYAGLMLLVGVTVFALVCARDLPPRLPRLLGGGWVMAACGPTIVAVDAWRKAHVPTSELLSSSIGHQFTARIEPVIAAGVLLAAACLARFRRARRALIALAGIAALVAMWRDVTASHAAAAHTLRYLRMAIQWAHFVAAGIWVGGLVALLVTLSATPPEQRLRTTRRFSAIALVCVAVIAASGVQRAYDEVGSIHGLLHAGFGQDVLVKAGLLGVLVVLGGVNRFWSVPAVGRALGRLRGAVRAELVLVAAVLVATGILQSLTPPTSAAKTLSVTPIVLRANDFATTVKVRLEISPGTAGFNRFNVTVADFDTGRPVNGRVSLTFALPTHPDLGQASLPLSPQPTPGTYAASAANLSIDGTWRVTAVIQGPSGAVEVPFTVTTRQQPQNITVTHPGSGLPDLYTLHLPGTRSVQTYLDPGHPGALNEFHCTFIGPDGQELPMVAAFTVTAAPGGELTVRRLDTIGHFVADLPHAVKATYRFRIAGTTQRGEALTATFQIPVK